MQKVQQRLQHLLKAVNSGLSGVVFCNQLKNHEVVKGVSQVLGLLHKHKHTQSNQPV